jgi:hypothetical protein
MWRARFRSTWSIVPIVFSDPPRAIYGIFYVDFTDAGFVRSDSTVPDLIGRRLISPFLLHNGQPHVERLRLLESSLITAAYIEASFDSHTNFVRDWIDCKKVQLTSHAGRVSRKRIVLSFLP